ncbi:hypothetical protein QC590_10775 [Pseudomonas putida]|uniref:hypothetical protein n=1 Tax=Pseudomonas putida TaxID=303 RepID=UPI0033555DF6
MTTSTPAFAPPLDTTAIPFTRYDAGWVVLCIGMAIGGGIVFLPIQIGLKGLWVFLFSALLAYPAIKLLQELYLKTLSKSPGADSYTGIITHHLGPNWGVWLSVAYFLMLLKGMLTYSLAIVFDSASYLKRYGLTESTLSDSPWYGLAVLALLITIASQGEKALFRVSGPMVVIKLAIVLLLGALMIPHWNLSNIAALPPFVDFLRDVVLTLPFTVFSILFVQILSPMNNAYRKRESDQRVASYRIMRVSRIAFTILTFSVLFFALSFTFALSHEQAVEAAHNNISVLAIAADVGHSTLVALLSVLLNVFAILTAFFGIYLGIQEALRGMALNLLERVMDTRRISPRLLDLAIIVLILGLLWAWVLTKFSILLLQQIGAPVYGIVSCLIPCYLTLKVKSLRVYRDWRVAYVAGIGVLMCATPIIKLFDS